MSVDSLVPATVTEAPAAKTRPLLEVHGLVRYFPLKRRSGQPHQFLRAVDGVSFTLERGETLGLVGESGCGKTTTGRMLARLDRPTDGQILVDGVDIAPLSNRELLPYRHRIQMVFQDPSSSLDPRMSVGESVAEPLRLLARIRDRAERDERVVELFRSVGLDPSLRHRKPRQLSGGQCQRVGVARALAVSPDIIVADEPTSALDVSVRAQAINLLRDLQDRLGISLVFISHDLGTVRHLSHRVAVMYLGRIVEEGLSEQVFRDPLHPYTKALLNAVPLPDPMSERERLVLPLEGEIPSAANPPSGCAFRTRCPVAMDTCATGLPPLRVGPLRRSTACHLVEPVEPTLD